MGVEKICTMVLPAQTSNDQIGRRSQSTIKEQDSHNDSRSHRPSSSEPWQNRFQELPHHKVELWSYVDDFNCTATALRNENSKSEVEVE